MLRHVSIARQSSRVQPPTFDDIIEARSRLEGRIIETPLSRSESFSRMTGREVWLKAECLQRAGSFKIRGALNALSRLDGAPVVAASAGNHAQGVALAAQFTGSACTVFMPTTAPIPKIEATRGYGAEIELVGTSLAEAVDAALEHAERTGAHVIHPYDDPAIVAGQGTLGLEVVEQLDEVGTVVVPTGGGGLLSGTALAVRSLRPEARMVAVEIDVAPTYLESRRAGRPVSVPVRPTLADGINVTVPSTLVFEMIEELVDHIVTVTDAQTTTALTTVLERAKLVTEPAGVVGVAALLEGLLPPDTPEPIVVVLSGGNIDLLVLGKYVRHGLEGGGRYAELRVRVPDLPGRLMDVLQTVAEAGANVVDVEHHREGFGLPFGTVEISIAMETRGPEHTERIRHALGEWVV